MASSEMQGPPAKRRRAGGQQSDGGPGGASGGGAAGEPKIAVELMPLMPSRQSVHQPTLTDVQNLLLRIFTSEHGENPKWLLVRGMAFIRGALVLLVPCLGPAIVKAHRNRAPTLAALLKAPGQTPMRSAGELQHFPSDQGASLVACRLLRVLLAARDKPAVAQKSKAGKAATDAEKSRPPVASYLASAEQMARSGYPSPDNCARPGWVVLPIRDADGGGAGDRTVSKEVGGGVEGPGPTEDPDDARLVALDCEMVLTASGHALARCTVVARDGAVLLDWLVKPPEPVTDHLTPYSGIRAEDLDGVTTTLKDVQAKLQSMLSAQSIIVGHSLENDLQALQIVHARCVDTAILYPHSRGWPHRNGLASLSSNHLRRKLDRSAGHDSAADARTALELALLKFKRGPAFAAGGRSVPLGQLLRAGGASLCVSDAQAPRPHRTDPKASWLFDACDCAPVDDGARAEAATSSAAPTRRVRLSVLRELEVLCAEAADAEDASGGAPDAAAVGDCLAALDARVRRAASDLAPDELFIMVSGCGNLHMLRRLERRSQELDPRGDARERARHAVQEAFGVFAVGGGALRARLKAAADDLSKVVEATPGGQAPSELPRAARGTPRRAAVVYDDV